MRPSDDAVDSIMAQLSPHPRGSVAYLQEGLGRLANDWVPVNVLVSCLVVTIHGQGWRARVLRAAMWAMRKAGHEVITLEGLDDV